MELTKKEIRGVTVVEIEKKLSGSPENSAEFHGFIKALLDESKNKIVISLRKTTWADSWGIGMALGAYTSVKNAGGTLVLAHVNDRINDILSVTRLHYVFKTFENEDEAVDYLIKGTEGSQGDGSKS
jgi:anti-sigma B factor antagonist